VLALADDAGFMPAQHSSVHRSVARDSHVLYPGAGRGYSVISYKTPWCVLGFLHGAVLLAGVGPRRCSADSTDVVVLLAALALGAARSSFARSVARQRSSATDQRNLYVCPHLGTPTPVDRGREWRRSAATSTLAINVMVPGGDYWPLPWYLRGFKEVNWSSGVPENPFAPIVVAGAGLNAALDETSEKRWLSVGYYEHRPRVFLEMFVELELWKRYVETLPRDRDEDENEDEDG
jgi:hypothetical protein